MKRTAYGLLTCCTLLPVLLHAGDHHETDGKSAPATYSGQDKSQYTLFHPTPDDLLRDFSTDRPDTTESPVTVDAGRYQIEASFFDFSLDRSGGAKTEVWTYGSFNLKAGLLHHVDLQLVFDSFVTETVTQGGVRDTVSGFGDIQTRLKINLWGNEGGPTALALMPFVKIPTDTAVSNGRWEGGVIVPFSWGISDRIDLGLMVEADFVHDAATGGYETEWVHSAVVGLELTERLGTFIEYVGVAGSERNFEYQASALTGLTYGWRDNVQLDAGVRFGLNDAAEDFGVFTGISVRY